MGLESRRAAYFAGPMGGGEETGSEKSGQVPQGSGTLGSWLGLLTWEPWGSEWRGRTEGARTEKVWTLSLP